MIDSSAYVFSWFAVPPLLVGILLMGQGILFGFRERFSVVSRAFLLLSFSLGLWMIGDGGLFLSNNDRSGQFWSKFTEAVTAGIPFGAYATVFFIIREKEPISRGFWVHFALVPLWGLLMAGTEWFVAGTRRYPWGYYQIYGPLLPVFIAYLSTLFSMAFYRLWTTMRQTTSETKRKQCRLFFIALLIGSAAAIDYLPGYQVPIHPMAWIPLLAMSLLLFFIPRETV